MAKNKGEWSEAYAFFKLLIDEELKHGGADLNFNGKKYKVLKVVLGADTPHEASYIPNSAKDEILIIRDGTEPHAISRKVIRDKLAEFFNLILAGVEGERAFDIPVAEEILNYAENPNPKASSREKADISITIHDDISNTEPNLGFSVKSQVGQASTLLNPSEATKFTYLVEGPIKPNIVNAQEGPMTRVQEIYKEGGNLSYVGMKSPVFEENLRRIDSYMPEILAEILKIRFNGGPRPLKDLVEALENTKVSSIHFTPSGEYYRIKLRNLLLISSTGMVPGTRWEGSLASLGGILIVKRDGELVCYLISSIDLYSEYLFNSVCIEMPSSSENKYDYAKIYTSEGKNYIDLCLQIRFLR